MGATDSFQGDVSPWDPGNVCWVRLMLFPVLLDPAVYTRPVGYLVRGKKEGAAADPGVRKRRAARMF